MLKRAIHRGEEWEVQIGDTVKCLFIEKMSSPVIGVIVVKPSKARPGAYERVGRVFLFQSDTLQLPDFPTETVTIV